MSLPTRVQNISMTLQEAASISITHFKAQEEKRLAQIDSEPVKIDIRDVENMLRHMYLLSKDTSKIDEAEREEYILDLITELSESGYVSYGCNLGSQGFCPEECNG